MGLFGNPRENKDAWAAIVMAGNVPGSMIPEETLIAATAMFVSQHLRIFYESVEFVYSTKNKKTKTSRFELAKKHHVELLRVKKYYDKAQKKVISQATDAYVALEDFYKHPHAPCRSFSKTGRETASKGRILGDLWFHGICRRLD